jgi:hypothetical protein
MTEDQMEEERIRRIAREVSKETSRETVREILLALGADADKPVELQKDFSFVRTQREFYSGAVKHGVFAIIGTVCMGIAAVIWTALKSGVGK